MITNYPEKQKNRIKTFHFDWFAQNHQNEYGNKTHPKKMSSKKEVDDYVNFWKNCDGCKIPMLIIEGPGFYIAMSCTGTADIKAYYLADNYDRKQIFEAYNNYMHSLCGQSLYRN
jgi:hypothetical protein